MNCDWNNTCRKHSKREAALRGQLPIEQVIEEALQDLRYRRCSIFEMSPVGIIGNDSDFERANPDHPEASSNRFVRIEAAEFLYRLAKNQNGWGIDEVDVVWEFFQIMNQRGKTFINDAALNALHDALFDRDAAVRSEVVGALAHLARTASIPFLERLEQAEDESKSIRASVEMAIACCKKKEGNEIRYDLTRLYSARTGGQEPSAVHLLHDIWETLITLLANSPQLLYNLAPRKFEELVAELLCREGLETHLTPSAHDKGRDILAFHETSFGRHLYLVECKRNSPTRPVDVTVVRQLFGVLAQERATAGIVVTTSYFTKDALAFRNRVEYQMALKDYDSLRAWLNSSKYKKPGIRNAGG